MTRRKMSWENMIDQDNRQGRERTGLLAALVKLSARKKRIRNRPWKQSIALLVLCFRCLRARVQLLGRVFRPSLPNLVNARPSFVHRNSFELFIDRRRPNAFASSTNAAIFPVLFITLPEDND